MTELGLLHWLAGHRAAWLDWVMVAATHVGRGGTIWGFVAVIRGAVRPRLAMAACQVVLAVMIAWFLPEAALKPFFARPRPFVTSLQLQTAGGEHPRGYSFPSGHASTAVAGAYALTTSWPAGRVICWTTAALVISSRAYLGVHYPTDLLGGALLGWFLAWFIVGGTRWRG